MMNDNICNIVGRLGRDPELNYIQSKKPYCRLSVAASYKLKDQEHTDWVPVQVWGELAENVAAATKKGDKVIVRGRFSTSSYEKNGQRCYYSQVVADTVAVCIPGLAFGSKEMNSRRQGSPSGNFGQFGAQAPKQTTFSDFPQPAQGSGPMVMEPKDEDIPF